MAELPFDTRDVPCRRAVEMIYRADGANAHEAGTVTKNSNRCNGGTFRLTH